MGRKDQRIELGVDAVCGVSFDKKDGPASAYESGYQLVGQRVGLEYLVVPGHLFRVVAAYPDAGALGARVEEIGVGRIVDKAAIRA